MKNFFQLMSSARFIIGLLIGIVLLPSLPKAALPTDLTATPIYDTTQAGLSFKKDKLPLVGMWEVPGHPQFFFVVGYFGYIWTLYPDTNSNGTFVDTTASWGTIHKYHRTQVADFNTWVMKGWEFGSLGGSFDPNFKTNHYFYVLYNKYPTASEYRAGTTPSGNNDGPNNPTAIDVVDRYIVSADLKSIVRDTEIFRVLHGTGYGSSSLVFGNDGMMYISADAYNTSSWDSTIMERKVLRIDVKQQDIVTADTAPDGTKLMYHIPTDNPWYNVPNRAVRKEIYAFGFRNQYSLSYNYLTGALYGAATGQSRWEDINHVLPGKNYGWNAGGDASTFGSNSNGIEGPCHIGANLDSTSAGGGFSATATSGGTASFKTPYSVTITGTTYNGTYTCANFENPVVWTGHTTGATDGLSNSGGTTASANVGDISPVFRGDTTAPLYGYMIQSDIWGVVNNIHGNFFAVGADRTPVVKVGNFPTNYTITNATADHDGITSWAEDSYGNLYPILLSSSSSGAFDWHDIWMLKSPSGGLKPLSVARSQVVPTTPCTSNCGVTSIMNDVKVQEGTLVANTMAGMNLTIPSGYSGVKLYNLKGQMVWSYRGTEAAVQVPSELGQGILQARFTR